MKCGTSFSPGKSRKEKEKGQPPLIQGNLYRNVFQVFIYVMLCLGTDIHVFALNSGRVQPWEKSRLPILRLPVIV